MCNMICLQFDHIPCTVQQKARKRNSKMILMSMKMMNLQLQLHFNPNKFSRSKGTFPRWHNQVCLLCQVPQGCLQVRWC